MRAFVKQAKNYIGTRVIKNLSKFTRFTLSDDKRMSRFVIFCLLRDEIYQTLIMSDSERILKRCVVLSQFSSFCFENINADTQTRTQTQTPYQQYVHYVVRVYYLVPTTVYNCTKLQNHKKGYGYAGWKARQVIQSHLWRIKMVQ